MCENCFVKYVCVDHVDEEKELILLRDTSESGQRASLIQEEHLTMYASRFLKETECYVCAQIEIELLAAALDYRDLKATLMEDILK